MKDPGCEPVFIISVAARLLEMHPQTLRKYEREGLIAPSRTSGNLRLYSDEDLERLRQVKYLVGERGLNLAGVQLALELTPRLRALQPGWQKLPSQEDERGVGPFADASSAGCSTLLAWTPDLTARALAYCGTSKKSDADSQHPERAGERGKGDGKYKQIHRTCPTGATRGPARDRVAADFTIRADLGPRARCSSKRDGVVPQVLREPRRRSRHDPETGQAELDNLPKLSYAAQPTPSNSLRNVLLKADDEAKRISDEYVSTEHLLLGILDAADTGAAQAADSRRGDEGPRLRGAIADSRWAESDGRQSGRQVSGAGEVRPRPDGAGPRKASSIRSSAATKRFAA